MLKLNLPDITPKVKLKDGKPFIFDVIRKKYINLTPEEWVRQNFVSFLITHKNYPLELIDNEVQIKLNSTTKRCDTIVYDKFLKPLVIIEYKAPEIVISKKTFDQITRYNMVLHVPYLIVSNGLSHYCCSINYESNTYSFLGDIPIFSDLIV